MKNLKKRILSLITAAAVAFSAVALPETVLLPDLSVTASAETEFTEAATWADLKDALTAGENVRLTGDVKAGSTDTALVVPSGKTVTLDLNGHTIDRGLNGKDAVSGGNVIMVKGNLTLTDTSTGEPGTITGGNIDGNGGGVLVYGSFTMNGGTISDCSAKYNGGGVCAIGTFTMQGGTISDCSASYGGGVWVYGSFTMNGGTISDCSANYNGGGVYVSEDGTFSVSGKPVISGNKKGDDTNNVGFANNHSTKTINVTGELTTDASIYVTAGKDDAVAVGSGGYPLTESDAEYFHSDNSRFVPVFVTEDNTEKVKFVGAWGILQSELNSASTDENAPTTITLSGNVTADSTDNALVVNSGTYVILDLNGQTIDRGLTSKTSGGNVITVNGNLTLTDSSTGGTITGGNNDYFCGGVFVKNGGEFTMSGGTISECKSDAGYGGGGVYVDGTFTMSGGTISGCSVDGDGGGVCVNGTFTMSGGEISSCSAKNGGGVGVGCYGTFTMSGGKILSCSARYDGGGVYVNSVIDRENVYSGTFNMSGGTISKCKTTDNYGGGGGGGGVSVEGTFTMSDGTISDCSSVMDGGGVCVNGTFTMSDSTISGCSSVMNGGGVSVENGGTFTMSDSAISGCSADQRGGGVYVDGTFTMQGGTISGCSAVMNGSGVYVNNSGTFNISGSPVISGNKKGDAANNVVATKTINVTDELDTDASVYVRAEKGVTVAVGSGHNLTESDAECFHSDIDAALASVLDNGNIVFKAELPKLVGIGSATYNGNAQSPLLMFSGVALTEDKDYTVSYKLGDTAVSETKNAGTYTVIVTGKGAYKGTFEKSYTINKKSVTVTAAAQSVEVDGSIHTSGADYAALTGAVEGHILTAVTLSTANAIDTVGEFSGAITPSAATIMSGDTDVTANYDITYEQGTLTVTKAKAKVAPAPTAKTGLKYTGEAQELVTGGEANTDMEYAFGTDTTTAPTSGYGEQYSKTDAGTYYVWYRAAADANHYASDPAVLTVEIAKATQTITAENVTAAYGETDKSVSASVTDPATDSGTISYAVKDGSEDYIDVNAASGALTIKKVGTATVIVTAAETANYAQATKEVTVTINKADINPTLSIQNKTYDGNEITYTIEDNPGDGTVTAISWEKQDGSENWSTVDDIPVNAGKYRGRATIAETDNYFGANTNTAEFTISKAAINPTVEITGEYTYTGEAITPTFTVKNGDTTLAETDYTVSYANNINAGENTASVSVSAAEGGNYTFTDVTENFSIEKAAINPTVSIANWVYGTTASTPSVTGNTGNGAVAYTYSSDGISFSEDVPSAVGSYTIKAVVAETANYLGGEATATFEITKVPATVTTAPSAVAELRYDSAAHELVSGGEANGGTMHYSLDGQNYSADIPTGTDAKTYTVYYKVVGDANHSDTAPQSIDVVIAKAASSVAAAPAANAPTYTGSAQALVTAGTANGGTMHYSLDGTSWNAAIPTGTNAGSYTVYYKVSGDGNHNDTEPQNVNVNVGKASDRTLDNLTRSIFRTAASISISVVSAVPADAGTISGYALNDTASTTGTVTASNAAVSEAGLVTATLTGGAADDTITVPVKITAQNYDCTINVVVTLTELADPVFTAPTAQTLTYSGSAQELVTAGTVTTGGTMQYSIDGSSWSTTVPTGTNAGSYTVYYKIDETDEVNGVTSTPVNVSIARKAAVVTADNKSKAENDLDPDLTATVTGLVGSDTVNYTLSRAVGEDIGTYTITPSGDTEQGNYIVTYQTGTFTITEGVIAVTSISLNKTSTTLNVGGYETLTATVLPDDATDKTVTWTSDNTAVATVANGVVTAKSAGTAKITASAGGKSATCVVTVKAANNGGNSGNGGSGGTNGDNKNNDSSTNSDINKIDNTVKPSETPQFTPASAVDVDVSHSGAVSAATVNKADSVSVVTESSVEAALDTDDDVVEIKVAASASGKITVQEAAIAAIKESGKTVVFTNEKEGYSITIDPDSIEDPKQINLAISINSSSKAQVKDGVEIPANSIVIKPAQKGEFGLTLQVTFKLGDDLDTDNLYLFYVTDDGEVEDYTDCLSINGDEATISLSHASYYVLSDKELSTKGIKAAVDGSSAKLTWDAAPGAESYTVYIKKNSKYKKFKTTSKTALTVSGLKNGKTYEFLIRYSVDGKLSEIADSYKVSVTAKYKPIVSLTANEGSITIKWSKVENAEKYKVFKYVNDRLKFITETDKLALRVNGTKAGKEYSYAVKAYVDGKWTAVSTSDIATVTAK